MMLEGLSKEDQNQLGDPEKLVTACLDLVYRQGPFQEGDAGFRLPFGSDALEEIRAKCNATLSMLERWDAVIKNTHFGVE